MRNLHLLKQILSQAPQASGTLQFNGAWPPLTLQTHEMLFDAHWHARLPVKSLPTIS
ncbi:MAG: hypothetical protein KGZ67_12725 [Hydrogenophaga sp.]|jgi:hypothetical protein|nr:hypothetical protein [Hydrogenophaga sp.]